MRPLAVVMAGGVVTMALIAGPFSTRALAAAPSQQGWWIVTNPGIAGFPAPPPPPDVPARGLLVQGGLNSSAGSTDTGATAFAAVVYDLPGGAVPQLLTLDVAPVTATTPDSTLELCRLVNPVIRPESGGPMLDAPSYDCHTHVLARPSPSGGAYQFNVAKLGSAGALAVAVLPTSVTDRVVLTQPGASSLAVAVRPDASGSGSPAGQAPTGAAFGSSGPGSDAGSVPTVSAGAEVPESAVFGTANLSTTGGPAASSSPPLRATRQPSLPIGSPALLAPSASKGGKASAVAVWVLVAAVLVGGSIWSAAGRSAARLRTRREGGDPR